MTTTSAPALALFSASLLASPLSIVVIVSLVVGLVMVVLFGYTSDQKAIKVAKDQLKAHLLAVRLFRDQLPVVAGSYAKILRGTGRYLKLAFMPLLYVIIPITLLMMQLDRYLGSTPLPPNTPFLLTAHIAEPVGGVNKIGDESTGGPSDALNGVTLGLPPEIAMTAPPVHIPADHQIVWRLAASKVGKYAVKIDAGGQSAEKTVSIGNDLTRISTIRLRGHFWERLFTSAESSLPENSPVESISIDYPDRNIDVAGYEMNWIWLFFILSMIAGFLFKELLGIQI